MIKYINYQLILLHQHFMLEQLDRMFDRIFQWVIYYQSFDLICIWIIKPAIKIMLN
jgi:hypothetical protein